MDSELRVLIPIVSIVGGLAIAALGMFKGMRLKELEYRERIALIERGLVPPASSAFGRDRSGRALHEAASHPGSYTQAGRHRTAGMVLLGIGLSLMVLISFTADVNTGIGVGGAFAVLGLAFIGNSMMELRFAAQPPSPPPPFDNQAPGSNVPPPPTPPVS